jgi:hypothetical protein
MGAVVTETDKSLKHIKNILLAILLGLFRKSLLIHGPEFEENMFFIYLHWAEYYNSNSGKFRVLEAGI